MELKCHIQHYEWGKIGSASNVATLYASANNNFKIIENTPYAELWMGTHINGPSIIKQSNKLLSLVIQQHPEYLGKEVINKFGNELPFLFKVLSVNKALSIQAHPAKKHAEELHDKRPDLYKDPNHKPEMAIALTPFEALCGFRPLSEIVNFIKIIPELNNVIGKDVIKKIKASTKNPEFLKSYIKAILTCRKDTIAFELSDLLERLQNLDNKKRKEQLADLVEKLASQYPHDVGCFMVYFLNYIKLQPSEAIYLGANEPHAYLSGDCIECMACSDNVVRAGLTPKFIDVETLCNMLDYKGEAPENKIFKPTTEDDVCTIFRPPVPDFAIIQLQIPATKNNYDTSPRKSASILIVISGCAKSNACELNPGIVIFLPTDTSLNISQITSDLLIYQAITNV